MVLPVRPVAWPARLGMPPKLAADFQPRSQTEDISRSWVDESKAPRLDTARTVLITGPSGVGKTQLAANFFEDPTQADIDLRLWVNAESRASVVTAFSEAADRVQAPVPDEANDDQKAAALLNWLSVTDRSWLVVFDNVNEPSQLSGLWPKGPGRVLATTYRQDAALILGTGTTVKLGVFSPNEAHSYIDRRIRRANRNGMQTVTNVFDEAGELAWDLGFLPVALAQAVSVILYQMISCKDYRQDFADRATYLAQLFPDRLPADEYGRTVTTTWSLALEQAESMEPTGLALRMVVLAAGTDPSGVPEAVLLAGPSRTFVAGASIPDESTELVSEHLTMANARIVLRNLHALSLIEHRSGSPTTVQMHGLTQRVVRESTPTKGLEEAVAAVADSLDAVWEENELDGRVLLLSNVEHMISIAPEVLWKNGPHGVLYRVGRSMIEGQMATVAIDYLEWLTVQARNRLGTEHPAALTACSDLACAYQAAGNTIRAIELFRQTLTKQERVLRADHPQTLITCNNLATAYYDAGRQTDAIELFGRILAVRERVLGMDHPHTLTSCNNLASAYRAAGRLDKAIPLLEQTLSNRELILGADHPHTLTTRNNLAATYQSSGRLDDAIQLFKKNMADTQVVRGPEHPETLNARSNLASAYQAAGVFPEAIELFTQVLADAERVLGVEHLYVLNSRNALASAYQAAGHLTEAVPLLEQSLAEQERVLDADHPQAMSTRNNLATAYFAVGRVTEAIKLLERNLTDQERVLSEDHPGTLATRSNLGSAYQAAGDFPRAIALLEQILFEQERVLSAGHPQMMATRNNLASAYYAAGDVPRAIVLFESILIEQERVLSTDHPYTMSTRNNLSFALEAAGSLDKAITLYKQTLADLERVLGHDHPHTIATRDNLVRAVNKWRTGDDSR